MSKKSATVTHLTLLALFFAGSIVVSTARAQSPQGQEKDASPTAKPAAASTPALRLPIEISPIGSRNERRRITKRSGESKPPASKR